MLDTKPQRGTVACVTPMAGIWGLPRNKGRGEVEEEGAAASPVNGQKRVVGRLVL